MAKSSVEQIRIDEKKVINELEKNARESIDEISRKCGFSRQKVWRLINRLEENATIWGYHAVADLEKIDLQEYILLIKKSVKKPDDIVEKIISNQINKKAKKLGVNIISSLYLHGYYDWIICFVAPDIIIAKKFNEIINKAFSINIKEIHLLESIFSVKRCGIRNPDIDKLKEFL